MPWLAIPHEWSLKPDHSTGVRKIADIEEWCKENGIKGWRIFYSEPGHRLSNSKPFHLSNSAYNIPYFGELKKEPRDPAPILEAKRLNLARAFLPTIVRRHKRPVETPYAMKILQRQEHRRWRLRKQGGFRQYQLDVHYSPSKIFVWFDTDTDAAYAKLRWS